MGTPVYVELKRQLLHLSVQSFVIGLRQIKKPGAGKMKNENAEAVWWIAGTQEKDNFFSKAIFNSVPRRSEAVLSFGKWVFILKKIESIPGNSKYNGDNERKNRDVE